LTKTNKDSNPFWWWVQGSTIETVFLASPTKLNQRIDKQIYKQKSKAEFLSLSASLTYINTTNQRWLMQRTTRDGRKAGHFDGSENIS
jgi:hypothetical protein